MNEKYHVGDLIYFAEEKRPYKIRACNERFLICTKSYPKPKTVLYTIVDLVEGIRGAENYSIGWCDYYKTEDCEKMLKELQDSRDNFGIDFTCGTYISARNRIKLNIINHKTMKKKTYEELVEEVARLKRSCASYKAENTKLRTRCLEYLAEFKKEQDRNEALLGKNCTLEKDLLYLQTRSWWERFKDLFSFD